MIDRQELHALADGELSPERQRELLAELAGDSDSAAELQAIQAVKATLQTKLENPDDPELWSRCQGRLAEIEKTRRVEGFVSRYAWGLCGIFFLTIVVGGLMNRVGAKSVQANDVAGYVAGLTPVPISQSQNKQTELEPIVRQVIGEAFKAKPAQMRIVSIGRNDIPGQRVGCVQLGDAFGIVSVMAMPDVQHVDGVWSYEKDNRFFGGKVDGMNALFWRENGMICMVVGQRSYDELHAIVTSMQPSK